MKEIQYAPPSYDVIHLSQRDVTMRANDRLALGLQGAMCFTFSPSPSH